MHWSVKLFIFMCLVLATCFAVELYWGATDTRTAFEKIMDQCRKEYVGEYQVNNCGIRAGLAFVRDRDDAKIDRARQAAE